MSYADEVKQAREKRDELIITLVDAGKTLKEIAATAKCSLSTIYFTKAKYGIGGKVGRPRKKQPETTQDAFTAARQER
jgi:transposase